MLNIEGSSDETVIPQDRMIRILFKDISPTVKVTVLKDGVEIPTVKLYQDHASTEFVFEHGAKYVVKASFLTCSALDRQKARAQVVLTKAEGIALEREFLLKKLRAAQTAEEYLSLVQESNLSVDIKDRLIETF